MRSIYILETIGSATGSANTIDPPKVF